MATPASASLPDTSDIQSDGTAGSSNGKWASPEDWMAAKLIIRKLYLDENASLKDVMIIMETQHDFHGTVKMYKSKLTDWGFFKTYKPREVLEALRTLEARKAAGEQDPKLIMRGTEVDIAWIREYIKRNKKRINKITRSQQATQTSSTSTPTRPAYDTKLTVSLASGGTIRIAEELLSTMNLYVDNSMSCGLWYVDKVGFYRSKKGNSGTYFMYDLWDRLDEASQAMSRSQEIDLITLLNPAFSRLKDIVREEDPRSLPFLLGCFEVLRIRGRSDLIDTFLKYTWQLSSTLLGSSYPHSRIWKQAYLMFRTGASEELIEQMFVLLMDRFHSQGTQQMAAIQQELGEGVDPYMINCTTGLHVAYKVCLEKLELTIKRQLAQLEADEQANFKSRSGSPEETPTTIGPSPMTADELRKQLAQLRADYSAGVLGILRSMGQFQEAQEALELLGPVPKPECDENHSILPYPCQSELYDDWPTTTGHSSSDSTPEPPETQTKPAEKRKPKPKRLKQPDKLTLLASLVESKTKAKKSRSKPKASSASVSAVPPPLEAQKQPSAEASEASDHLRRLIEHLLDTPSVYRDEGWINWIFEGLVNVPKLSSIVGDVASRRRLSESRAIRLAREKEFGMTTGRAGVPGATATGSASELQREIATARLRVEIAMGVADASYTAATSAGMGVGMEPAMGNTGSSSSSPDPVYRSPQDNLKDRPSGEGLPTAEVMRNMKLCAKEGVEGGCPMELATGRLGFPAGANQEAMGTPAQVQQNLPNASANGSGGAPIPLDKIYEMETTCRGNLEAKMRS